MRPTRVIAICLGAFGAVLAGRSAVRANRVRKRLRRLKICLKSRCFGTPSSFAFQGAVGVVIAEDDPGCLVSVVPIFRWSPLIWQPSISPCITTRRGHGMPHISEASSCSFAVTDGRWHHCSNRIQNQMASTDLSRHLAAARRLCGSDHLRY